LFYIDTWLIVVVAVCICALLAFIISRVVKAHHPRAITGEEELIGGVATARTDLNPEGTVFFKGELWSAVSEGKPIKSGEIAIIKKIEGLKLFVIKK